MLTFSLSLVIGFIVNVAVGTVVAQFIANPLTREGMGLFEREKNGNVTIMWNNTLAEVTGDDSGVSGMRVLGEMIEPLTNALFGIEQLFQGAADITVGFTNASFGHVLLYRVGLFQPEVGGRYYFRVQCLNREQQAI